ncbi:hypothetical protein RIF29_14396 [Crotalaria pallida]|uniref:Uncharacterized protein n=1 Tax=Crotalaria pallida TaxID=3830 RepID=A0AAN9FBF8_CROPI
MARKRGRPPKSPLSSSKATNSASKGTTSRTDDALPIDFEALDDLDLDNLSPKKQSQLLMLLDELKAKIKGKSANEEFTAKSQELSKEKSPETIILSDQNKDSSPKEIGTDLQNPTKRASGCEGQSHVSHLQEVVSAKEAS